jgi:CDP-glucose 4,6-dehydratase
VLVTGAAGFVGSWLTERLVAGGAQVVALLRDAVAGSTFHRLGLERAATVVRGAVEDEALVERALREYDIDTVFHLAAQALVGVANDAPASTFRSNVQGTWSLLEAARAYARARAIVVASSDKAYGAQPTLPYREDQPLEPRYPYDVSKACADLIARSYAYTFGLPVTVARCANVYGPGDLNFSRIVPDTVRRALGGLPPVLRSDGSPERDYLYVDDVVEFYLLLGERIDVTRGEVFNAGLRQPVKVLDLVHAILRAAGRADLRVDVRGRGVPAGEIDRQWLDASKARRVLGWEPRVPLEEGLRRTVAWYAAQPDVCAGRAEAGGAA